jgi:hypothetical protein
METSDISGHLREHEARHPEPYNYIRANEKTILPRNILWQGWM